ncbi:MAG TPA: Yip1 family protein [Gaiellaceae bacterium]|nr:Yip1 family protein [Gaiellaceae bacterium]
MRDWWLRTLLVLQHPRPVFVALRDESKQSLSDRAEPIMAIVILAGIAGALASGPAGHLMDPSQFDPAAQYDAVEVAIWAFIAGGISGVFGYFILGGLVHRSAKLLGSQGTFRRNRQILAFAAVPIALSLALWPVKLALYGGDVFRTGGSDAGTGSHVFAALELAFIAWAVALLVIGVRAVHGWTWQRAIATCVVAVAIVAVIVGAVYSLQFIPGYE